MAIERHHTNDRMSQLVIHGDTVYLAGQVAQGSWAVQWLNRPRPFWTRSITSCRGRHRQVKGTVCYNLAVQHG